MSDPAKYRVGCVTLDVVVPASAIQPWREPVLAGDGTLGERDEIPQGTPLATRSGHVVGVAAWPLAVKHSDGEAIACTNVSVRVAGRLQTVPAGGSGPATVVELCAPASKVKHRKASHAWPGEGLGSSDAE